MSFGIMVPIISIGYSHSTSESATNTIKDDTVDSWGTSGSQTATFTCEDVKEGEYGVGLWQFVTAAPDGSSYTYLPHYVCRYNENYNTPPDCPYTACLNGECTECDDSWMADDDDSNSMKLRMTRK
jgi:hypothetical protein